MKINIDSIIQSKRKRQLNSNKVKDLAESIKLLGLINPITVRESNGNYELIAGLHRLEAYKLLGKTEIEATIFEAGDEISELAEIDENLKRNDLTILEQGEHLQRRNEILDAMGMRAKASPGTNQYKEVGETVSLTKTTEEIAKEVGISERSVQQKTQIARDIDDEVKEAIRDTEIADSTTQLLEIARMPVEEQKKVAKKIKDGEKTVKKAKRAIIKDNLQEKIQLPSDKYRVIYADPPWQYGNTMPDYFNEQADHYRLMTVKELCELPIIEIVEDNAVLFLWVTSPILEESFQIINSWGFKYKSSFIWDKVKHVMGHYNSVRHEILLVCVRGSCQPDVQRLFDSVYTEERTEHSKKPEYFRTIIDTIYPYGKRIELFARNKTEGWDVYGNEI